MSNALGDIKHASLAVIAGKYAVADNVIDAVVICSVFKVSAHAGGYAAAHQRSVERESRCKHLLIIALFKSFGERGVGDEPAADLAFDIFAADM